MINIRFDLKCPLVTKYIYEGHILDDVGLKHYFWIEQEVYENADGNFIYEEPILSWNLTKTPYNLRGEEKSIINLFKEEFKKIKKNGNHFNNL